MPLNGIVPMRAYLQEQAEARHALSLYKQLNRI